MSSVSLLALSRCVLLIGDECLYIYDCSGGKTLLVDTIPWGAKEFEQTVAETIRRECRGKPVLIVNDMTDQHFKGGQRIPKVGTLDKASVVDRKLAMSFPNYPIRGALPIKDKLPRSMALKANASGGLYLFAAVPMSEAISKTLSAARMSMASIAGFVLLPIESSDLVRAFSEKIAKRDDRKSRWAVLIGQHMGGGLRQVVTRDGQLAMTRMTPVSDLQSDPTIWANEVAQEFKATISYLSRFGYSPDDGTEVIIIAPPAAGDQLQDLIDLPCNIATFTVSDAAEFLGFKTGQQDDQHHADPLHVAWAARKSRFIMPMEAPDIKKIYGPRQAAMVAMVLLVGSGMYLSWVTLSAAQRLMSASGDLQDQKYIQANIDVEYQKELDRMKALGFDIKLIQGALNTMKQLEGNGLRPLPLLQGVGKSLGQDLRIDKLVLKRNLAAPADPDLGDPAVDAPKSTFEATLTLSFPPTVDPEAGVEQVNKLTQRLGTNLPTTYQVGISKQVADLSYTENTIGQVGTGKNEETEDFKAEIIIKGPLE